MTAIGHGSHTAEVRAIAAGTADPTPAVWSWTVDQTPPETWIDAAASGPTGSGAAFACQLDAGAWAPCASPAQYDGLAPGSHVFRVKATDALGNEDASPADSSFTLATRSSGGSPTTTNTAAPAPAVATTTQAAPTSAPADAPASAVAGEQSSSAWPTTLRALSSAIAQLLAAADARELAGTGGFAGRYHAKRAGTLRLSLRTSRGVLVGSGRRTFNSAGRRSVPIRLTPAGRTLARRSRRAVLKLAISFDPVTGRTQRNASRVVIARR
jgi:hypothetical protein